MNNSFDSTYHQFLKTILSEGQKIPDRTGTGTLSIFNYQMEFDISTHFPLITSKRVHFPSVAHELLWFMSRTASTSENANIQYLKDNKVRIWNEWADEDGNLGPVYGAQWRHWKTSDGKEVDQLANLIENIKQDPYSRRHILTAWNVGEIGKMALPPCHLLCQFYVSPSGHLNCKLFQRSADAFLGVPFNIASYSLLTYIIADLCNLKPGKFVWSGTDCHIYLDHIEQVKTQLERTSYAPPTLTITPCDNIDEYTFSHIQLHNYQHHPSIKAKVSV